MADFVISRVFGDSDCREILRNFLQSILTDIEIITIDSVKQAHLDAITIKKKFSRIDILATLNGNIKVNIEMQMDNNHNTIDRSLYYADKLELLNNDEKAREIAEMLIDAERNERSALAYAKQEGHAEGIAQEKIEVVKKMLERNLDIDLIVDITGISKSEILKIKNNL